MRTTKIVKTQSRTKELFLNVKKDFASFDELDETIKGLKRAYNELEQISEEVSAKVAEREQKH